MARPAAPMQLAHYTTRCVTSQPSPASFLAPLPPPPFSVASRAVPQVPAPGLPGLLEGVWWGLGGGLTLAQGPVPRCFPLGG